MEKDQINSSTSQVSDPDSKRKFIPPAITTSSANDKPLEKAAETTKVDIDGITSRLGDFENEMKTIRNDLNSAKVDIKNSSTTALSLLAVFVGLFTFISIQFQLFSSSDKSKVIPLSIFFGSMLLLFLVLLSMFMPHESQIEEDNSDNMKTNLLKKVVPNQAVRIIILTVSFFGICSGVTMYGTSLGADIKCTSYIKDIGDATLRGDVNERDRLSAVFSELCS